MMIKYYTQQNPPQIMGETFTEPSLTRESDYVSLENLFERFCIEGRKVTHYKGASDMTEEEKEQLLAENDVADLVDLDIAEQRAFADSVLNQVLFKQEKEEKEPTQTAKQDVPEQPKADEPKDA